jgi:hypothetical protein
MLTITHCERFKDKFNIAPMLESLGARLNGGSFLGRVKQNTFLDELTDC